MDTLIRTLSHVKPQKMTSLRVTAQGGNGDSGSLRFNDVLTMVTITFTIEMRNTSMSEADQGFGASEKILEAVDRIRDMASTRPEEAAALLERAQYLAELAQQIKDDWAQRWTPAPASTAPAVSSERVSSERVSSERIRPKSPWVVTLQP